MKPPRGHATEIPASSQHAHVEPGTWSDAVRLETYLVGLDQDEDAVHPTASTEEWDDFGTHEVRGTDVAEDAHEQATESTQSGLLCNAQGDFQSTWRYYQDMKSHFLVFSVLFLTGSHCHLFTCLFPIQISTSLCLRFERRREKLSRSS